jgi:hypothetical protein
MKDYATETGVGAHTGVCSLVSKKKHIRERLRAPM